MTYFELPSPAVSCWNSKKYIHTSLNTRSLRFLQSPGKSTLVFLALMYFRSSHHSLNCSKLHMLPTFVPNCCYRKLQWGLVGKSHSPCPPKSFGLEQCRQEDTVLLQGLLGFLQCPHRHMELGNSCRGRQWATKGSGMNEAISCLAFGWKMGQTKTPQLGRSGEELGHGRTMLSFRNGKMRDYLCQSNLNAGTKQSIYKDWSKMRRMKTQKKIMLSVPFWMQTDFVSSKYTPQSPFQILLATGIAADNEPTSAWGTWSSQILNFCLFFLCLDR